MLQRALLVAAISLGAINGTARASSVDTASNLHPYIGGELSSANEAYLNSPVNACFTLGMNGSNNSFGLQFSIRDIYAERSYSTTSGTYSSSTTDMTEMKVAVIGVDLRHYLRPINDPRHAPFFSLSAGKILLVSQESSGNDPKPKIGGFTVGLGLGEEVPVGALSLFGKIGGRYQLLDFDRSSTSSSGTGTSTYSSSSKSTFTMSNTSLDLAVGLLHRF